ncbi:MAG: hypothetical protein HZB25_10565 [Candidatus Eisenbacteria bacterium]|nr:hypothetical protein [Candidatus Eisenbacteria bacterium]
MAHDIQPFHSALDYLVSLSQVIGARRESAGACEALRLHREREVLGLTSGISHERGPLGLADNCGLNILEVRILAYLFLSEGTCPRVPVFLDVEEMCRLIADGDEARRLATFLEPDEVLLASGCVMRIRVGERWMVALTDSGREAFVSGEVAVGSPLERAMSATTVPQTHSDRW